MKVQRPVKEIPVFVAMKFSGERRGNDPLKS